VKETLRRLLRIERLRTAAMQAAAADVARAEAQRCELTALAERTRRLAGCYGQLPGPVDGAALTQATRFAAGLEHLCGSTSADAERACEHADQQLLVLAEAENGRATVADRAAALRQRIAARARSPRLEARRRWHES